MDCRLIYPPDRLGLTAEQLSRLALRRAPLAASHADPLVEIDFPCAEGGQGSARIWWTDRAEAPWLRSPGVRLTDGSARDRRAAQMLSIQWAEARLPAVADPDPGGWRAGLHPYALDLFTLQRTGSQSWVAYVPRGFNSRVDLENRPHHIAIMDVSPPHEQSVAFGYDEHLGWYEWDEMDSPDDSGSWLRMPAGPDGWIGAFEGQASAGAHIRTLVSRTQGAGYGHQFARPIAVAVAWIRNRGIVTSTVIDRTMVDEHVRLHAGRIDQTAPVRSVQRNDDWTAEFDGMDSAWIDEFAGTDLANRGPEFNREVGAILADAIRRSGMTQREIRSRLRARLARQPQAAATEPEPVVVPQQSTRMGRRVRVRE